MNEENNSISEKIEKKKNPKIKRVKFYFNKYCLLYR